MQPRRVLRSRFVDFDSGDEEEEGRGRDGLDPGDHEQPEEALIICVPLISAD